MLIKKHCKECSRILVLTQKDLENKPLKCVEMIKIFKEEKYKVNSLNSYAIEED